MYLVGINICMNGVQLGIRCFTRSTVGSEFPHWRFERVAANGVRQNTSAGLLRWKTKRRSVSGHESRTRAGIKQVA